MFIQIIWKALERYYREDHAELFKGRPVKEECINHRIALYLQTLLLETTCGEFCLLTQGIREGKIKIDLEYDKSADHGKIIDGQPSRPDILIHRRGDNSDNFAFLELKKNYLNKRDVEKCRGAKESPYEYKNVLVIDLLSRGLEKVRIHEFLAGRPEKIHKRNATQGENL